MHIAGVLVRTFPEHIGAVSSNLNQLQGVEVHGNNSDGRIIVTIEKKQPNQIVEVITQMTNLQGVLNTSMIYHQFEEPAQ